MPSPFHALVAATGEALPGSVMCWRRNSSITEIRTPLLPPSKMLGHPTLFYTMVQALLYTPR